MSAPQLYPSLPQGSLKSVVEIHVSCNNLLDQDVFSKSDPMVVLFMEHNDSKGKSWRRIGHTEVIKNNLNPVFTEAFIVDYYFEEYQKLKFEVYDIDSKSSNLEDHDLLGLFEVSLGSIVGENCGKIVGKLLDRKKKVLDSTIQIAAEKLNKNNEEVTLSLKGVDLDKKDFFGKSDPFLVFYRHGIETSDYTAVHKTEVVKNTLNPQWKSLKLTLQTLCNGDKYRPIKIECYDWDSNGSNDLIGQFEMTINDLVENKRTFELINYEKKKKKKNYKNSGKIEFLSCHFEKLYSFLDYIFGVTELCFHVAVDFTASNGNPSDPRSLHYRTANIPNQYMQALQSVGKICEDYDSDKLMPAYGFGANIGGITYHNFNLNQAPDPSCFGVQGVMDAYFRSLAFVELYGPTNFSPIINQVANQAASSPASSKYHVLLIVTDGIISDMPQTKQAIINASKLPISIIIVGVGHANFEAMDELDSDNGMLSIGAKQAERDIVQFVPFRKFSGEFAGEALAKEVLLEVPNQLVSFYRKRNILPTPTMDIFQGQPVNINNPHPNSQYLNSEPPPLVSTNPQYAPYPTSPGTSGYNQQYSPQNANGYSLAPPLPLANNVTHGLLSASNQSPYPQVANNQNRPSFPPASSNKKRQAPQPPLSTNMSNLHIK